MATPRFGGAISTAGGNTGQPMRASATSAPSELLRRMKMRWVSTGRRRACRPWSPAMPAARRPPATSPSASSRPIASPSRTTRRSTRRASPASRCSISSTMLLTSKTFCSSSSSESAPSPIPRTSITASRRPSASLAVIITRCARSAPPNSLGFPEFPGPLEGITTAQNDHINSGVAGLRLKPIKPLTITLDSEVSFANHPFTPIADRNFHALRGRVQYKAKSLLLSAAYRQDYNTNSISLSVHSSRARNYSFNASWTPRTWFSFDAGYSKLHLNSVSGIAFFASGQEVTGLNSIYVSNLHAANLGARFAIRKTPISISATQSPGTRATDAPRRFLRGPQTRQPCCSARRKRSLSLPVAGPGSPYA